MQIEYTSSISLFCLSTSHSRLAKFLNLPAHWLRIYERASANALYTFPISAVESVELKKIRRKFYLRRTNNDSMQADWIFFLPPRIFNIRFFSIILSHADYEESIWQNSLERFIFTYSYSIFNKMRNLKAAHQFQWYRRERDLVKFWWHEIKLF